MKRFAFALLAALLLSATAAGAATSVPGHTGSRVDENGNGSPDAGVIVVGHYTSLYAYDGVGGWFQDLGDGRVRGNVGSVEELDAETLTVCDYVNGYRGDFGDDPFLDSGWVSNNIRCHGFEKGTYRYQIVHESDPRYRGNPDWAIWGNWEYHVLTESGSGNLVRPINDVG